MKWHKKMTDHLDDPFIQDLICEFGGSGYMVYFGIIALVCRENKNELTGKATFSMTYLRNKFNLKSKTIKNIIVYISEQNKFVASFYENKISFDFPKILEIKDNYSKDLQVTCKKLAPKKEKKNKEVEEELKPIVQKTPSVSGRDGWFPLIWNDYPNKLGKHEAWLKFRLQVTTEKQWGDIQKALVNYKKSVDYARNNGHPGRQYQNGSTWFDHRWEDYINWRPPDGEPLADGLKRSKLSDLEAIEAEWDKEGFDPFKNKQIGAGNAG